MKKIVRLTESDLTRIVKRVIKENEEKDAIEKIAKFVFSKLPKDDIEFIGNLYKELGYDKFEDTIEDVVNDDLVTERVSFSTSGFEAENEEDIQKIENIKDKVKRILGFNTSTGDVQDFARQLINKIGLSSIIPVILQMIDNGDVLKHPSLSVLLVPIMVVLGGLSSRAVEKAPINVSYDFDEKIRGGKFQKMIDSKLDNLNKKEREAIEIIDEEKNKKQEEEERNKRREEDERIKNMTSSNSDPMKQEIEEKDY